MGSNSRTGTISDNPFNFVTGLLLNQPAINLECDARVIGIEGSIFDIRYEIVCKDFLHDS